MDDTQTYTVNRTAATPDDLMALVPVHSSPWASVPAIMWGGVPYRTWFRAMWDASHFVLRYDVEDAHPWHTLTTRDAPLWEEEVVEIFLDPDGRGHHYAELEISPANVVCDVRMIAPSPHREMDLAWDIDGLETHTLIWPTRDETGSAGGDRWLPDVAAGWTALARFPFASLASLPSSAALPPRPGDAWRFNVFRIKRPLGPRAPGAAPILAAWSPTGGPSFHVPAAFRPLVFR